MDPAACLVGKPHLRIGPQISLIFSTKSTISQSYLEGNCFLEMQLRGGSDFLKPPTELSQMKTPLATWRPVRRLERAQVKAI